MYYPAGLVEAAEQLSALLYAPTAVRGPAVATQAKHARIPAIHPDIYEHLEFLLVQDERKHPETVETYSRLVSSYEGVVQSELRAESDYETMQGLVNQKFVANLGFPHVLRKRMLDPLEDPARISEMFHLWMAILKWCGRPEVTGRNFSTAKIIAKDMRGLAREILDRVNKVRRSSVYARIKKKKLSSVKLSDNTALAQKFSTACLKTAALQATGGQTVGFDDGPIFPGWIRLPAAPIPYKPDFKALTARIATEVEAKPDDFALDRQRRHGEVLHDDLSHLIGLKDVKEELRALRANLMRKDILRALHKKTASAEAPSHHLVFIGPPGTAKTTIARETGKIYKSLGLLKTGHVVEVKRADFVGQYIGHTAPKTQAVLEKAYDGVLFIDEAYDLFSSSKNDFGHEAITQLVAAMENERHRLVVIIAGYPAEMKQMLTSNSGFASRFGLIISFSAYTLDELCEIFELKMAQNNLQVSKPTLAAARARIAEEMDANPKTFGNGRFVRNLVYGMEKAMSLRLMDAGALTPKPLDRHETPMQSIRRKFHGHAAQELMEPTPDDVWKARIVGSNDIEDNREFGFVPKRRGPHPPSGT